jgi:hypothetical protein
MSVSYSVFVTRPGNTDNNAPQRDGVAVSATNTYYSEVWAQGADGSNVHVTWTGTPTGALTIWASTHQDPDLATDADWFDAGAIADPAGSASGVAMDLLAAVKKFRLKYVNASGSGTMTAVVNVR